MSKQHLLIPFCYLTYVWQAALRPDIAWNGYSPNFLVLAAIAALWCLSDSQALIAVGVLGLLSDSLSEHHLGSDLLCFLTVAALIQTFCPPRLLRQSSLLLILTLMSAVLIEFSTTALRATLNHELGATDESSTIYVRWALMSLGNGLYTAVIAAPALIAMNLWSGQTLHSESRTVGNHWHRLTS